MRRHPVAVNQGRSLVVYNWLNYIHKQLFPHRCCLCLAPGADGLALCAACRDELPWLPRACERCARPLAPTSRQTLCAGCRRHPPVLDHCRALFAYQPPVDRWIQALKFDRDLSLAGLLGQLLASGLGPASERSPQVLPVPLHPRRLRQRGFNQAGEICRPLYRRGWPRSRCRCRRIRHTEAQSGLSATRRGSNLRGAFSLYGDAVKDRHLLLIDDVMTTGATLNELARTLKAAGAARVEACVIARTLRAD